MMLPALSMAQRPARTSMNMKVGANNAVPVVYKNDADISQYITPAKPVAWGMDVAWNSSDNVTRGTNWIGQDILSLGVGRVSFQPSDLVDADGNLSAAQIRTLKSRLDNISISGVRKLVINCDHEVLMNKESFPNCDQNYANYNGKPEEWYKVIKATVKYCKSKGYSVVAVSPFNEPDYTDWKEGTQAEFKEIARLITEDPEMAGIAICAGNTLNCDQAMSWYNASKPYVTWGNTHQLAGSFDNYAKFWTTVSNDGNFGCADELHNTMEAFVGIHYGMLGGIWWGYDGMARGEFCKASFSGKEIGYAESRGTWTAAAVYKRDNGRIDAFIGTSERQANNANYNLISADRPAYYDGYGPVYNYPVSINGGTGYQKGQTNAERMVQIHHGEDVPLEPLVNGTYVIMNVNSLKCMSTYGNQITQGNNVVHQTYKSTYVPQDAQKWTLEWAEPTTGFKVGGDLSYFFLRQATKPEMLLDLKDWSTAENATLCIYPGGGGALEQWAAEYAGDGNWYIRSRHSGLYLQTFNNLSVNNQNLIMKAFTGADNQKWRFIPADPASGTKTGALEKTQPAAPTNLVAEAQGVVNKLTWAPNTNADHAGYIVYRKAADAQEWDVIGRMLTETTFIDNDIVQGTTYQYKVKAVDNSRNMSKTAVETTCEGKKKSMLVAHYLFENTADDESENYFDAGIAGTATYNTTYKKQGTAALTCSATSYAQLPSGVANSEELTIGMWIRPTAISQWARIFDFGNSDSQYMFLTVSDGSKMRFGIKNGGTEQYLAVQTLVYNSWYYVAVTLGKDAVKVYVNGEEKASSSDITIRPSDFCPKMNFIGKSQFLSDPLFRGQVDDVRIYNYALSADDVKKIMNGEDPAPVPEGMKGDANGDNSITMDDANMVVNYYLGNDPQGIVFDNADANSDGAITMDDANIIVNMYLGE